MPRLEPWLFRQARRHSPHLAALLPACKDLQSARNELRWITEHVDGTVRTLRQRRLARLCRDRGRRAPLQYLLGSQPFAHLDIKCRPGVLVPRPETEAYTCHLVDLIKTGGLPANNHALSIVDFCTGTGCIALALFSLLQQYFDALRVLGVDIAREAVKLGQENISRNVRLGYVERPSRTQNLDIVDGDVFDDQYIQTLATHRWDILVSNPPYVSQQVWNGGHGQLDYSVRKHEPRLALVPGNHLAVPEGWEREDAFYARMLDVAALLQPGTVLLELGDEIQARRVLARLSQYSFAQDSTVELWRDYPDLTPAGQEDTRLGVATESGQAWTVPVKGRGGIRCIYMQRATGHDSQPSI